MKKLDELLCWYYLQKCLTREEYAALRKLNEELSK